METSDIKICHSHFNYAIKRNFGGNSMKQCQLTIPAITYAGQGSIEKITEIIECEQVRSILIFTDKGVRESGLTKRIEELCSKNSYTVIDDLASEPSYQDVERVIEETKGASIDFIIGVGGGSVMDVSKLASIVIGAEYSVRDLLQDPSIAKKYIKTVMIPTTCGTGSEATCNAIVAIPEKQSKQGIVNNCMIPDYVILDADMINQLPPKIIAATGVDALAHVVECFTSKKATILSDTYAKEGACKIFHNIREAYADAANMEAKMEMLMGAFYGGIAITGSGTTAVHALSYPLGGKYHIAHGVSNAILFAHVMEFNKDACANRLAMLCDAVYPEKYNESVNVKADYIIEEIKDIVDKVNIPTNLEELGVKAEDLDFLVEAGSQQQRLLVNNCKELSLDDIRYIYKKLF
jgi:alcohol dehydrogenase class IV